MKITIKANVFKTHPTLRLVFLVAKNISNEKLQESRMLLQEMEKLSQLTIHKDTVRTHYLLSPWELAKQEFGKKAKHYHTSIEKLLQKVLRRGTTSTRITVLNILNFLQLKHTIPGGVVDFNKIKGDILFDMVGGDIVSHDEKSIIGKKLDATITKRVTVSKYTKNTLIHFDILPPISVKDTTEIVSETKDLLEEFCGAEVRFFMLDRQHKSHTLK